MLTQVGQRIEADFLIPDFDHEVTDAKTGKKRLIKTPTHGGAIAAYVFIDCYSGKVRGQLVKTFSHTVALVKWTLDNIK